MALPSYTLTRQDKDDFKNKPLILHAQYGIYDDKVKKIFAQGHVEILQGAKRFQTESLCFDQKNDILTMPSKLYFEDGQGTRFSAQSGWTDKTFSKGSFQEVRLSTAQGEKFTAQTLSKPSQHDHILSMASYTPCLMCKDELAPTWSLHAQSLHHDGDKKEIIYKDVSFSFLGHPLLAFPFLRLPTHRASGFLRPSLNRHNVLGMYLGLPYYWAPSPSYDFTFMPIFTTSGGLLLNNTYRHQFQKSFLKIKGGLKIPLSKKTFQGCLHTKFTHHFNPYWRFSADQWWISHKTFLSTHPFFGKANEAYLESKFNLEGFYRWTYFSIRTIDYKGLQETDAQKFLPKIYPEITASYYGPLVGKSFLNLQFHGLYLHRSKAISMKRLVLDATWNYPWKTSQGIHGVVFGRLLQGLYHQRGHTFGYCMPQGGGTLQWPLNHAQWIITPQAQLLFGPKYTRYISSSAYAWKNEDSQGALVGLSTLFSKTRYAGYDRLDVGSRMNYGVSFNRYYARGHNAHIMMGQSMSWTDSARTLRRLGAHKGLSDFFGLFQMNFSSQHMGLYRVQINRKTLKVSEQMVLARVPLGPFMLKGHYIFSKKRTRSLPFSFCHQLGFHLNYKFASFWSLSGSLVHDFSHQNLKNKTLEVGGSMQYENDCFAIGLGFQKVNYRLNDLKPGYKIHATLFLRNIGGVKTYKDGHRDFG